MTLFNIASDQWSIILSIWLFTSTFKLWCWGYLKVAGNEISRFSSIFCISQPLHNIICHSILPNPPSCYPGWLRLCFGWIKVFKIMWNCMCHLSECPQNGRLTGAMKNVGTTLCEHWFRWPGIYLAPGIYLKTLPIFISHLLSFGSSWINSLAPGSSGCNFKCVIFRHILVTDILS